MAVSIYARSNWSNARRAYRYLVQRNRTYYLQFFMHVGSEIISFQLRVKGWMNVSFLINEQAQYFDNWIDGI